MCVELNAHAMIVYIMLIRDHFHSNWNCFVPWVLGSQTCEKTFHIVRSMSTVFSSVINFSILGLLHRLHRINIQLTLQVTLKEVVFPSLDQHCAKEGKNLESNKPLSAIRDADIANAIDHAKTKARNTIEILGMEKLMKVGSLWEKDYILPDMSSYDNEYNDDDDVEDSNDDHDIPDDESLKQFTIQVSYLGSSAEVEDDVTNAFSNGVITEESKKVLTKLHKALRVAKLPSNTISIYKQKIGDPEFNPKLLSDQHNYVYIPFIKVNVKGQDVLIRKTTAIWLFQETERISADRLFRVRLKQPFASVTNDSVLATQAFKKEGSIEDAVVIREEIEYPEICSKTKYWVHIGKYKLTLAEREILIKGQWLNDLHVNAVQHLVKNKFPQFGGLQNTVLFQSATFRPLPKGSLQILHINNNHWIVVSILKNDVDITVYDSLNASISTVVQPLKLFWLNYFIPTRIY